MTDSDLKEKAIFALIGIAGAVMTVAVATETAYDRSVMSIPVAIGCVLPGLAWAALLYAMSRRTRTLKAELSRLQDKLKIPFQDRVS